ncbi:MAG: hypothetical protein IKB53_02280 [Oscillospiraceae bacterium]|nr:hypothetical protein [Oscillospiraceae bacterium]
MAGVKAIRTKTYAGFRGVDFAADPSQVDASRSPWALNMIADAGGVPEKRTGWRTLQRVEGRINGLFYSKFDGEQHLLAHAGEKLLRWYEDGKDPEELRSGLPNERSCAVYLGGKLWIFTGAELLSYDGKTIETAEECGYTPTTVIARDPAGGGVSYEAINLVRPWQTVRFLADGTSTTYYLPYENIEELGEVKVNGAKTSAYTTDLAKGTVTFSTAPAKPAAGAEDNVYITFKKSFEGYADRIGKCGTAVVWGVKGLSDRIVASGNSEKQNWDFISGYADGGYWPDTQYAVVGTDETAIVGYRRLGENLAIIKEDNGQDSTVFIRVGSVDDKGEAAFTVRPCLGGAGAVSRFGFGNIGDEQLLLTGGGVYAITTNSFTAERVVQNRSFRIDPKLRNEELIDAVCCSYDSCFMVFVSGKVYGLDGRQPKSYPSRNDTAFLYECFYWENIPARCVLNRVGGGDETLFFGTEDGRICRFNTDRRGLDRYNDDGAAITAIWSTKADDDGDSMRLKTMIKQGNAVTLKPFSRSSAQILFRTDRDTEAIPATDGTVDIFRWEDIDFSRFTFNVNDGPQEIPFRRKVKNYKRLQIVIKNDVVDEGFGVYGIVKHFVAGNFAKK